MLKVKITFFIYIVFAGTLFSQNAFDGKGRRHGMWEKKFENGNTRYKGAFNHGVEIGTFTYYYPDGKKRVETHFRGKTGVGMSYQYDHMERKIAQGLYKDQKRDSTWLFFNDIGETIEVVNFSEGGRHGETLILYGDGTVMEKVEYVKGVKHGPFRKNYDTGKLWAKGTYVNGKLHGEYIIYDFSGDILSKGKYNNGYKHGAWYFSDKGTLDKKVIYRFGYEVEPKKEK